MYTFKASLVFLVAVAATSMYGQEKYQANAVADFDEDTTSTAWDCADVFGITGPTTEEGWTVCCDAGCGTCGGDGCSQLPGGEYNCCASFIRVRCGDTQEAPCLLIHDVITDEMRVPDSLK